jgi:hypothetical protein
MNSNDQYRRALSQGMTPCEAEQEVAEAEEYERVERDIEARKTPIKTDAEIELPTRNCPHCDRELEEHIELESGLCTSDDCPRHDEGDPQ